MKNAVDYRTLNRQVMFRIFDNWLDECEREGKPVTIAAVREYLRALKWYG